jgi:hypothetical protein
MELIPRHLPGDTEENHESSVRMGGVPAEIRNEDLPKTSLQSYGYMSLLGLHMNNTIHLTTTITTTTDTNKYIVPLNLLHP